MKSIVVTFLMFVVVFIVLKFDVLAIIDSSIFKIGSFVLFGIVMACAVHFVGIPTFKENSKNQSTANDASKKSAAAKDKRKRVKKHD